MKKNRFVIILLGILFTTTLYANKYTLGVFPYFDAAKLASLHKPLKDYLSSSTNNEIRLISAPNFKLFKERTSKGHYDILITAPHFGRNAQNIANYEWLGFTSNTSHAVFVSHIDSGITTMQELKTKSIALPPKSAIIHHLALNSLLQYEIIPKKNIDLSIQKSHNNAMLAVIHKKTDAAAFGAPTWAKYKSPDKNKLRKIGKSEDIPGFAIMVHKRVPFKTKEDLKKALFLFSNTKEGKSYFDKTGLKGIRKSTTQDMILLDKYLNIMNKENKKVN